MEDCLNRMYYRPWHVRQQRSGRTEERREKFHTILLFLPIMAIFAANLWCAYQSRTIFMKQGFISQSDNPSLFRNIVIGNIVALAISGFAMINAFIHAAAGS